MSLEEKREYISVRLGSDSMLTVTSNGWASSSSPLRPGESLIGSFLKSHSKVTFDHGSIVSDDHFGGEYCLFAWQVMSTMGAKDMFDYDEMH